MRDHLATLLDDFRRHGRDVAVVRYQGNRRRAATYQQIAHLAGRFAALLAQRNIQPGDRVLLWAENSAEWIAAFYGCLLRGVLAVPLDAAGTSDFAARVAADVSPKLAVGDALLLRQLPSTWPTVAFEDWLASLPAEEAGPVPGLSRETPLQILFTSGTTGEPKGIVITHGNVLASIGPIENASQPYLRYVRFIHPLRILHTLPLSHVFGQTMGLWIPSIYSAEVHFENRLVASRLIETIRRERISVLAAVPRVLALLKAHLEATLPGLVDRVAGPASNAASVAAPQSRARKRSPVVAAGNSWWRFRDVHRALGLKFWALISGGGALPAAVEKFWNRVGFVVVQGYGMTETTALITLNHPFHVAQGTIGKPLAGREVKLGPDGEVLVRGDAISAATWSGGTLHPRSSEWLATGDLAETQPTGELRFLGRKSEVIVTASGLNLHPEDLEAAIEQQPGVAACAVVPLETAAGPEPCAVLAFRGSADQAAAAIQHANARLAEFQRLSRWRLWPEPDLPRTSTGKVRRSAVAKWLADTEAQAAQNRLEPAIGTQPIANSDWLLTLIVQITGEAVPSGDARLRLTEDLHLDSLGRVQLAAAIESRMGSPANAGTVSLDQAETLGDLRRLLSADPEPAAAQQAGAPEPALSVSKGLASETGKTPKAGAPGLASETWETTKAAGSAPPPPTATTNYIYPHWPWWSPIRALRIAFLEAVARPLVWFLANPKIIAAAPLSAPEPLLIVANHVTAFDGPLLEYALPAPIRRRIAVAMSGEMLEHYRRFRSLDPLRPTGHFFLPGPMFYFLLTALFNVFPLPRQRDFQRSFAHAGEALDRGFHVMVFPEGARSQAGSLARFRPGIGLLVKQSQAPVLPMAVRGLGDLKTRRRGWFRSGAIEVLTGQPIRFAPTDSEAAITARLHAEVEKLLNG
jgi:long-chain acyl-CoA synthetase